MEKESQKGEYDGGTIIITEEQMETLRKQIAVYAVICDQLHLLHNSLSSNLPPLSPGMNSFGRRWFDPIVASSSTHGMSTRHRWTPKPMQLEILERIYKEGSGTPNPRRVREITIQLSEHGQITEKNVYNWFQNRRARSKRKRLQTMTGQADDTVVTTEERKSCGDSQGFESYDHILFPTPDLGIEDLLSGESSWRAQFND